MELIILWLQTKGGSHVTTVIIVLEGLKGRPVAELCNAHQISQAQYYQWRDQFLANANRAFEMQTLDQRLTHF